MELLADHPAAGVKLVGGHVGDFQQHGRHQVHALQQLQVDVHVEWNLQPDERISESHDMLTKSKSVDSITQSFLKWKA